MLVMEISPQVLLRQEHNVEGAREAVCVQIRLSRAHGGVSGSGSGPRGRDADLPQVPASSKRPGGRSVSDHGRNHAETTCHSTPGQPTCPERPVPATDLLALFTHNLRPAFCALQLKLANRPRKLLIVIII